MDPQFQELAREISEAVTAAVTESVEKRLKGAFGDSEARIKKHIDEFENRAEQRLKMHFESMDEKVKLAAEGYGATLEGIERRLSELNKKVGYVRKAPSKKRVPPHN
jgi:uncharacterized protein Yka (UPF0111/DUF47 family)